MMENGILFSEMKLRDKYLKDCELVLECNSRQYRLYLDKFEHGFFAMAIAFHSCVLGGDIWECKLLEVDQLFEVTAYFDGVRHLEYNREAGDVSGYMYYPNMDGLIELMQKVREIEKDQCSQCD